MKIWINLIKKQKVSKIKQNESESFKCSFILSRGTIFWISIHNELLI